MVVVVVVFVFVFVFVVVVVVVVAVVLFVYVFVVVVVVVVAVVVVAVVVVVVVAVVDRLLLLLLRLPLPLPLLPHMSPHPFTILSLLCGFPLLLSCPTIHGSKRRSPRHGGGTTTRDPGETRPRPRGGLYREEWARPCWRKTDILIVLSLADDASTCTGSRVSDPKHSK